MKHLMMLTLGAIVALAAGAMAQTAGTTNEDPKASEQARVQAQNLGPGFVDNDGSGTCDYYEAGTPGQGRSYGARAGLGGRAYSARNGTGTGVGPLDGSGYGVGAGGGVGACDGTGPKGNRGRRGPRR